MIIFDAKKMEAEDLVKDREDIELSTDRLNEYIENLFSGETDKETAKAKLIQYVNGLIKLDRRTAIAQLHQYKECIVDFDNNGERIVKGVYAVIPRKGNVEDEEYMKFFEDKYRTDWGFGAFVFDVLNDDELNKELEKALMVVNGV
jgi:c-di-AMP phosphodiesterase-like protein